MDIIFHKSKRDDSIESGLLDTYRFSKKLAKKVRKSKDEKHIFVGGDHSTAIGTWSGLVSKLKRKKPDYKFGLLWVDAHMDSHTKDTSESGFIHGFPLAILMGHGDEKNCNIEKIFKKLNPNNVFLIGTRSYEAGEQKLLDDLGVRYISPEEYLGNEKKILKEVFSHFEKNCDGYGVSLDLDCMEPEHVPGTGCLVDNGLSKEQVVEILNTVEKHNNNLQALELVEYLPHLDDDEQKTKKLCLEILGIFKRILQ